MLGAPAGGGVARRFVARQVPDALDVDALRADEVAEVADRDMVDVRRFVPGDGQQPRHRHPPAPQEREPDAPVREIGKADEGAGRDAQRSEEHTSDIQSLMRISYAVFCLKTTKHTQLKI